MAKSLIEQLTKMKSEQQTIEIMKQDPVAAAGLEQLKNEPDDLSRLASVLGNDRMQKLLPMLQQEGDEKQPGRRMALTGIMGALQNGVDIRQINAYEQVYGDMRGWLSGVAEDHQFESVVMDDFVTDYLMEGTNKEPFIMILKSIQDVLGDQKSDEDVYQYLVKNLSDTYLEKELRAVLDRGNEDADNPDAIDKYLDQLAGGEKTEKIRLFHEAVLAQCAKARSVKRENTR